jgi:hypothetical protein
MRQLAVLFVYLIGRMVVGLITIAILLAFYSDPDRVWKPERLIFRALLGTGSRPFVEGKTSTSIPRQGDSVGCQVLITNKTVQTLTFLTRSEIGAPWLSHTIAPGGTPACFKPGVLLDITFNNGYNKWTMHIIPAEAHRSQV